MKPIDLDQVVCAWIIPGVPSLAAALLTTDGTWQIDPGLRGLTDRQTTQRWIDTHGPHFAHYAHDLMKGTR